MSEKSAAREDGDFRRRKRRVVPAPSRDRAADEERKDARSLRPRCGGFRFPPTQAPPDVPILTARSGRTERGSRFVWRAPQANPDTVKPWKRHDGSRPGGVRRTLAARYLFRRQPAHRSPFRNSQGRKPEACCGSIPEAGGRSARIISDEASETDTGQPAIPPSTIRRERQATHRRSESSEA